jgi:hypothetical protein
MPISTAEGRMSELKRLIEQLASESEYFHTPDRLERRQGVKKWGHEEMGTFSF